jgi:hypothetical protein
MAMATRMHVNGYPSLLDKALRLHDTCFDGAQRQGLCGFGHDAQTDSGDSSTTQDSREHAAAINFRHWFAPR